MPRFSVILIHYQGATSYAELRRGADSLRAQTYRDFELLAYHNGPLLNPDETADLMFRCSDRNMNDWGYANRDRGMREASGDYIVHFNADNVLYPNALEEVSAAIDRAPRIVNAAGETLDTNNCIVFGIVKKDCERVQDELVIYRKTPLAGRGYDLTLTGNPPRPRYVDALQFVMRRHLWLDEGGWTDQSNTADGIMATRFAAKYGYRAVDKVLGEQY